MLESVPKISQVNVAFSTISAVKYVKQLQTWYFSHAPKVLCVSSENDSFHSEGQAHWMHLL